MVYVASIHTDLDSLSRDLDILCNIFPIPIYVLVIITFSKVANLSDYNLILFYNFQLT